jgi:deoxycytidylate deaminase
MVAGESTCTPIEERLSKVTVKKPRAKYSLTAKILDKRGRVLSIGNNSYDKTHPLQIRHALQHGRPEAVFMHAEIQAIVRCKDLSKAKKIIVSRVDKEGNPKNAKPCLICESAIREAGIEIVEYTTDARIT